MNFPERQIVSSSSTGPRSFVSQEVLEEKRRQKQEEWDKIRKPDDPIEAPEEEYDPRTLFERLQEHKMKKQADLQEAHKLSNMIRGLESDEVSFLAEVDNLRERESRLREEEERKLLQEFERSNDVTLTDEEQHRKKLQEIKLGLFSKKSSSSTSPTSTKKKVIGQAALISKAVKRKVVTDDQDEMQCKKIGSWNKSDGTSTLANNSDESNEEQEQNERNRRQEKATITSPLLPTVPSSLNRNSSQLKVLGILPGIGVYGDSSDSENSDSDSDLEIDSSSLRLKPTSMTASSSSSASKSCQQ